MNFQDLNKYKEKNREFRLMKKNCPHLTMDVISKNEMIDIIFEIKGEPLFFPYLETLFENLIKLGYVHYVGDYKYHISLNILKFIEMTDNGLELLPFWHQEYCIKGVRKSYFTIMQLLIYELKDFYEAGFFRLEILLDGKKNKLFPVWPENSKKIYTTKKHIAKFKKRFAFIHQGRIKKINKCNEPRGRFEDGYISACCLCNPENQLILRYNLDGMKL